MTKNPEILYVAMKRRTREALRNLFFILDIEGRDFDDKIFELAARAFSAKAKPLPGHSLRKRARSKQPRKRIEIKQDTADQAVYLHNRLFPYLPWQSWNWYIEELLKIAEDTVHESKEMYESYKERQD